MTTKIEWTDETWNPVTGCSKVSEGCRNCYAEMIALRKLQPYDTGLPWTAANAEANVVLHEDRLDKPLRWKRPRRIFVNSMSDLFHDQVPDEFIDRVVAVMALSPQHTFQVLTKRPERMRRYFADEWRFALIEGTAQKLHHERTGEDPSLWLAVTELPSNVRLGVSVEDQETADERIPFLLRTPAAVRFVSAEPLLGPLDLRRIRSWHPAHGPEGSDALCGGSWGDEFTRRMVGRDSPGYVNHSDAPVLDQVIVGGESGPGARPMHPDWVRTIRDQCVEAGVAFFFKQHGEWASPSADDSFDTTRGRAGRPPAFLVARDGTVHCTREAAGDGAAPMVRVGKKAAGRELDGRTWDEEPGEVRR